MLLVGPQIVNISSAAGSMTMGGMMIKAGLEWGHLYMAYKMSKSALNMSKSLLALPPQSITLHSTENKCETFIALP